MSSSDTSRISPLSFTSRSATGANGGPTVAARQGPSIRAAQVINDIAKSMNPTTFNTATARTDPWTVVPYQSTHNTGGTIMGTNPRDSVLNKYLQSWDVSNLFVVGASAFPQNAAMNPTGTVGALAYWTAEAIRERYLSNPGRLM